MSGKGRLLSAAVVGIALATLPATTSHSAPGDPDAVKLRGPDDETVVVTGSLSEYILGPSDKVRITVYDEDDLSGEFQIDSAGFVRLPLLGEIKAAGLTAHQLEASLSTRYDAGYLVDAHVAVEVTAYQPIYVIGQVTKPGQYEYASNMSVLDAIALAGGFNDKAQLETIGIRHEGSTEEDEVTPSNLVKIEPGDVVRVRETTFWSVADILAPLTPIGYVLATAGLLK